MTFALAHGNTEIHQHRSGIRHHHIRRFDIAVHNTGRMHGLHRLDQLAPQPLQIVAHIPAVGSHILTQILALDQLGHNEGQSIIQFHIHNAAHARMTHLLQRHSFPTQALACGQLIAGTFAGCIFLGKGIAQNFHRILVSAVIAHTPDRSHCSRSKP